MSGLFVSRIGKPSNRLRRERLRDWDTAKTKHAHTHTVHDSRIRYDNGLLYARAVYTRIFGLILPTLISLLWPSHLRDNFFFLRPQTNHDCTNTTRFLSGAPSEMRIGMRPRERVLRPPTATACRARSGRFNNDKSDDAPRRSFYGPLIILLS